MARDRMAPETPEALAEASSRRRKPVRMTKLASPRTAEREQAVRAAYAEIAALLDVIQ
jgi:hypothetical protein